MTAAKGRCPICRAPTDHHYRPFCSRRCADVDLSRWLTGGYAIAGREDTEEDGAEDAGERKPVDPARREEDPDADV